MKLVYVLMIVLNGQMTGADLINNGASTFSTIEECAQMADMLQKLELEAMRSLKPVPGWRMLIEYRCIPRTKTSHFR